MEDAAHPVFGNGFAYARLDTLRIDVYDAIAKGRVGGFKGIVTGDVGVWEDALKEGQGELQGFGAEAGVHAALKAERGVRVEAVALGPLPDHDGVKPGRF